MRITALTVTLTLLAAGVPRAQAPDPAAAFDVASVKLNKEGGPSSVRVTPGGMLTVTNNNLRNIIRNAWNITNDQIVGGPDWIDSERFDIAAKASAPFKQDEARAMLQALLADRFGLATHMETRELPVYLLVLARKDGALGPQMKKSDVDCAALFASVTAGGKMPERLPNGNLPCGISVRGNQGLVTGNGVAMDQFARNLVGGVGRIVVDKTGLPATTTSTDLSPEAGPAAPQGGAGRPGTGFDGAVTVHGYAGAARLKHEPGPAPISVLVIDAPPGRPPTDSTLASRSEN
jgi:uncharacterized protein (TIGR03435 family)